MDFVSKIDRCGVFRQIDNIALGGEDEDAIVEDIQLHFIDEFSARFGAFLDFHQFLHPRRLLGVFSFIATQAFVTPMSRDTVERFFVHLHGADLKFGNFVVRAEDGGVQTAVAVRFGDGDIILDAFRHRFPEGVDNAHSFVAVGNFHSDDAQSKNIINLVEFLAFDFHFAVDAVQVLESTFDIMADAVFFELSAEHFLDFVDELIAFGAFFHFIFVF